MLNYFFMFHFVMLLVAILVLCSNSIKGEDESNHFIWKNTKHLSAIHFAIILPFYRRSIDPEFLLLFHRSIIPIKKQTFQNWTLILVGDGLDHRDYDKVNKKIKSILPQDKVVFLNINESRKEVNVLQGQDLYHCTVWCFAGANAFNEGLDFAANNLSFVSHIAVAMDDDSWKDVHLEYLVNAYNIDKNVGFVNTRAFFHNNHGHLFPSDSEINYSNGQSEEVNLRNDFGYRAPVPSLQGFPSSSWSFLIPELRVLRLRLPAEQHLSKRTSRAICCDGGGCGLMQCRTGLVMADDADLWERVNSLIIDEKKFKGIFVNHVTLEMMRVNGDLLSGNIEDVLKKIAPKFDK